MRVAKRHIILLALCALWALSAQAQPRLQRPIYSLGIHGGVSAGYVLFQPSVDNMKPIYNACVLGGNGGIVFRYAGHKYCALQIELNYMHRGWAEKSGDERYTRSLHYVDLPVMMHLNFGSEQWRWFFNLGPQIGYCVKDEGNAGTLVNGAGQPEYEPVDHPFNWGLIAGTGVYCHTRKAGTYQIEFRFDYSFGGIFGTGLIDHYTMASPMDLSINIAWLYNIKKKH